MSSCIGRQTSLDEITSNINISDFLEPYRLDVEPCSMFLWGHGHSVVSWWSRTIPCDSTIAGTTLAC